MNSASAEIDGTESLVGKSAECCFAGFLACVESCQGLTFRPLLRHVEIQE
jgi:hypothetical protein